MSGIKRDKKTIKNAEDLYAQGYTIGEISIKMDIPRETVRDWIRKKYPADKSIEKSIERATDKESIRLKDEIKELKLKLKEQVKNEVYIDDIRELINDIKDIKFNKDVNFDWLHKPKNNSLVPVFCLSDTHIGSRVIPENINNINGYNVDIAKKRIYNLTKDFISMYKHNLNTYKYDGCVVIFGGDMIENAMHNAEETNELTVIDQVIQTVEILINVIENIADAFGKVTIFAVSGNHGRLIGDKYVKINDRLNNSLEKIVYHFITIHFKNNKNINLVMNKSDIVHFNINGLKFRLEHGDSIRFTGQAISGALNSWERARLKKSSVDEAVGNAFDILIFGHFHQHSIQNKLICMDSTKGYDSYANSMALSYSKAGATTFAINKHGELIYATNLKCREIDFINEEVSINQVNFNKS